MRKDVQSNSVYQDTKTYEITGASTKTPGRGDPSCHPGGLRHGGQMNQDSVQRLLFDEEIVIAS